VVAGVDQVYGLYTGMVTTIVAALTGSNSLIIVTLTNHMALVTADALVALGLEYDPVRSAVDIIFIAVFVT
jgi:SulP family sulfate permease